MTGRIDPAIVPSSVSDLRGRAFGRTMQLALDEIAFRRLLVARIDEVPDELLPYLVREFGMQKFVEPGMSAATVRRMLKGSYLIHSRMGFVDAVRNGLDLLGVRVIRWEQWFQATPSRPTGTHRVRIELRDQVFEAEGRALTFRMQRAVRRMIDGTKRWSQDITPLFQAAAEVPVHVGAVVFNRIRIRPLIEPVTHIAGEAPIFVGAAVRSRIAIRPGVP